MTSKFTNSLLLSLIVTLSIFSLSKINFSKNSFPLRLLSSKTIEEYTNEVCDKASSDLSQKYKLQNFEYDVPEGNEIVKTIINDFNSSSLSSSLVYDYTKVNISYLLILILCFLLLILWIPFLICICCHCCCGIPDSCTKSAKLILIIGLCLITAVILCCFIGYSRNSGINEGVFGAGCGIFKIENHIARGDEYEKSPYWIGVNGIISKLKSTVETIEEMRTKAEDLEKKLSDINSEEMEQNLNEEYKTRSNTKISSPLPSEEDKYTPEYIQLYGPESDTNTVLGAINKEYKLFIENTGDIIKNVLDVINLSDETFNSLTSGITSIEENLGTALNNIETKLQDVIDQYYSYIDKADSYSRISMNCLFSFNLVVAIAVAVSLLFLLMCKKGKCLLALSWFILFFFMIFSLLFGAVFGILSNFLKDVSYGVDYSVKNIKNLNISSQLDDKIKDSIDICLNGNGSLANSELLENYSMESPEIIDSIYTLEDNITEGKSQLENYELVSINESLGKIDEIKEEPSTTATKLAQAFNEIRKYIDSSVSDSYVSKTEIYEVWVSNKNSCPEGYSYISTNSLRNLKSIEGSCLVISEWTSDYIEKRYEELKKDDGENCLSYILSYYNSITLFLNENSKLLDDISTSIEGFNKTFKETVNKEIAIADGIWDAVKPIKDLYEEFIGNGTIFDMLNCGFLKRDVNILLEQINEELGGSLKSTSNIFIFISLFEFVLTLLVLILMKSFNDDKKGEEINNNSSIELPSANLNY